MEINDPIIADSSALVSLVIEADQNYQSALKESKRLLDKPQPIIIPGDVFSETVNILGKKFGHSKAIGTGKLLLEADEYLIIETTSAVRSVALAKFEKQPESVSFTDCLVMAFADQYGTKEIFGFDDTFKKNGYQRLGLD